MTTTPLVVGFLLATFNWNLQLLSKHFRGISKYRFWEWVMFGWGGRLAVGGMFLAHYHFVQKHDIRELTVKEFLTTFAGMLALNLLWTAWEVVRDRRRYHAKSLEYFKNDPYES